MEKLKVVVRTPVRVWELADDTSDWYEGIKEFLSHGYADVNISKIERLFYRYVDADELIDLFREDVQDKHHWYGNISDLVKDILSLEINLDANHDMVEWKFIVEGVDGIKSHKRDVEEFFIDRIEGQCSDGVGETLEQQPFAEWEEEGEWDDDNEEYRTVDWQGSLKLWVDDDDFRDNTHITITPVR